MTRCPACGRRYDDHARFCAFDGAALVAVGAPVVTGAAPGEPGPVGGAPGRTSASGVGAAPLPASRALGDLLARTPAASGPDVPPTTGPLPEVPGRAARYAHPRPTDDAPVAAVEAETYGSETDEAPRRSRAWKAGLAVTAALLLGGAVGAYVLNTPRALEREATDAIERGDLVTPTRVSAYDFAQRLAERYPKSGAAGRVGATAFPRLIAQMDAFYARFYTTSEATRADWTRTARLAEWATAIAPADAHVRARAEYAAARVAAINGDGEAARAAYERAAAAWPEWALPPNSLGVLLAQDRDFDGAEARYREAAALDPAWSFPLANLGGLYLRLDRYDSAESALDRAVAADPERPYPHAMLARAYAGQDRLDRAIDEAGEALRLDPTGAAGFDARRLRADVQRWRARRDAPPEATEEESGEEMILDELIPADEADDL